MRMPQMRLLMIAGALMLLSLPASASPDCYGSRRGFNNHYGHRYFGYRRYSYRARHGHSRYYRYGYRRYGSTYGYWRGYRSYRPYRYGRLAYGYRYGCASYSRWIPRGYRRAYVGYFVRPYAALAPIYSRYGASLTLADEPLVREPGSDAKGASDKDGLPQERTERIGKRFLVAN